MAQNGISTLQYKRDRQDQKLTLAGNDRTAVNGNTPGRYAVPSPDQQNYQQDMLVTITIMQV